MHFASFIAAAICFSNLRPKQTSSTELSNLHEVVTLNTHIKFDCLSSFASIYTGIGKKRHVLSAPSECISELLSTICTCIAEVKRIHSNRLISGKKFMSFNGIENTLGYIFCIERLTYHQHAVDRIRRNRSLELCKIEILLGKILMEQLSQRKGCTRASHEVKLYNLRINTLEKFCYKFSRELCFLYAETKRIDTLLKNVKRFGIRFFGAFHFDVLTNIPIVVFFDATHIRELARCGSSSLEIFNVFQTIERLNVEAFCCAPYKLFIKVGAFQIGDDFVLPFLSRNRSKISSDVKFVFCHKNVNL